MNTGMQYFIVVARERNISRAAEKLHISQQALSDQMKRLEEEYGATLFYRKPRFVLTTHGAAVLKAAQKISIIEKSLAGELDETQRNGIGKIRVGINSARVGSYFPRVMRGYHELYPQVEIEVIHNDTSNFETMLLNGDLDLFLGIDARNHKEFEYTILGEETLYAVATRQTLANYLGSIPEVEIDCTSLAKLPLIVSPRSSNIRIKLDAFFQERELEPNYIMTLQDFDVQIQFVAMDVGACFCPLQIAKWLLERTTDSAGDRLRHLQIAGLENKNKLSLVTYKNIYQPNYLKDFAELMKEIYSL